MTQFKNIKTIITDIEGTTSSISFVKETLFPYATNNIDAFIRENIHEKSISDQLDIISTQNNINRDDVTALIQQLLDWIKNDVKATPLKTLQGMVWKKGYEKGDYHAHMYSDATANLKNWHGQGVPLYVYSSGSVQAQKLFFTHSQDGNLLPLFNGHFDTNIGHKQEQVAYDNIQQALNINPQNLLFLSDIAAELDAAKTAGFQTCHLVRDGKLDHNAHHVQVSSFDDIQID